MFPHTQKVYRSTRWGSCRKRSVAPNHISCERYTAGCSCISGTASVTLGCRRLARLADWMQAVYWAAGCQYSLAGQTAQNDAQSASLQQVLVAYSGDLTGMKSRVHKLMSRCGALHTVFAIQLERAPVHLAFTATSARLVDLAERERAVHCNLPVLESTPKGYPIHGNCRIPNNRNSGVFQCHNCARSCKYALSSRDDSWLLATREQESNKETTHP